MTTRLRLPIMTALGGAALLAIHATAHAHPPASSSGAAAQRVKWSPPADRQASQDSFEAKFVGAERGGEELVWEGRVIGAPSRTITIHLTPLITPNASAESVWPVHVQWKDSGSDGRQVVTGVDGIIEWKKGELHASGPIGVRAQGDSHLMVDARVRDLDFTGTFNVLSTTASR